jgi:poly(hydroxyalkanoate) granule-associated protein
MRKLEMTEKIEIVNEKKLTDKVVEFGRESLYFGLGIVSVVQENVEELVKKGKEYRHNLVERGEKMADENKDKVSELVEMPQSMAKDTYKKAGETFDKYSEQVLTRVHIPTADVIETMTKKVNAVDRKLDKLIKENAAAEKI